jgi:hypothetical protein
MAMRVRANGDFEDILNTPFFVRLGFSGADRCPFLIKERANPGKPRKIARPSGCWQIFPTNSWREIPSLPP